MSNDEPNYVTSKTDAAPWAGQQPYLTAGFQNAQNLLNSGQPSYYPNATYVPMSGDTSNALGAGGDAAYTQWGQNAGPGTSMYGLVPGAMNQTLKTLQGDYWNAANQNPLYQQGQNQTAATMRGDFVNQGNPQFQGMLQNMMNKATPGIDASFASGGRGISGARDAALADAWTNTAGNLAYQNYAPERQMQNAAINAATQMGFGQSQAERQAMLGATAAAPGMVQAGMAPLQQLGQIGAAREGYAGQEVQDALKRWDAQQNQGWSNAAKYASLIGGGGFGQQTTQMVPQTSNPWLTAAGLGGSAATIAGSLFGRGGVWGGAT